MFRRKWATIGVVLASMVLVAAGCRSEQGGGQAGDSGQAACQAD